jgi:hypothetical protein
MNIIRSPVILSVPNGITSCFLPRQFKLICSILIPNGAKGMNKYTRGYRAFTIKLQHDDATSFVGNDVCKWECCIVYGKAVC